MGALSITDGEDGTSGVDRLPALVTPSSPSALDRGSPRRDGALEESRSLVPRPPPGRPDGPAPPLRKSLKQLQVKEHIYGRTTHPLPADSGLFEARQRLDVNVPVGSPTMQQT